MAVGRVAGAWGVSGELKVESLAPEGALTPGRRVTISGRDRTIERSVEAGRLVRLKLTGIDSREEARLLRGTYLQVPEGSLEPLGQGEFYRFQLLGLNVRGSDGNDLGRVEDIFSTASNDVYVVRGPLGEILIPAVDEVVLSVDIAGAVMIIEVVPGLRP